MSSKSKKDSKSKKSRSASKKDSKKNVKKDKKSKDTEEKYELTPYQKLKGNGFSDGIISEDLRAIIIDKLDRYGPIAHHIDSFNVFISVGLPQIVTQLFSINEEIQNQRDKTPEDRKIKTIEINVKFTKATVGKPSMLMPQSGKSIPLSPAEARKRDLNYSAPLDISAIVTAKAYLHDSSEPIVRVGEIKDYKIATIPTMVRSNNCHTSSQNMTADALENMQEDALDHGGYFIIKGGEWVIDIMESRRFNYPHHFRNIGHKKEIVRLELISKPGDDYENSREIRIKLLTTGEIVINLTSAPELKEGQNAIDIPFYIIFRIFGWTSDREIFDNILFKYTDEHGKPDIVSSHMQQILENALKANNDKFGKAAHITERSELIEFFAKRTSVKMYRGAAFSDENQMDESTRRYINDSTLKVLDENILPHIGLASDSRHMKLRYLALLIRKVLLVEMRIVESTDRDSLKNKRLYPAGRNYAKVFKTQFNIAIVEPVKKYLTAQFEKTPFTDVPLVEAFKNAINGPELEKALKQAITTGDKEIVIKSRTVPNRLASEQLHRKNQANVLSTERVIRVPNSSSNKQNKRADEMRRVHPSYINSICPIQSADTGAQVGLVKQLSITAIISESGNSMELKDQLREDELVIPIERVFREQIAEKNLSLIMVNGDWIGCTEKGPWLIRKYIECRRGWNMSSLRSKDGQYTWSHVYGDDGERSYGKSKINEFVTIYWDTDVNEIHFTIDAGRCLFPMLIVRNNDELDVIGQQILGSKYDPYKNTGFVQDVIITKEIITKIMRRELSVMDLHKMGYVDYLSPEELEKSLVADSIEELQQNRNNPLLRYTHCQIPEAIMGLIALISPYAHKNEPTRTCYETNQAKQTDGPYALNWPFRWDKHAFYQYYNEVPLVSTLVNRYIYPNGLNVIVAIQIYNGDNQEDSILVNKSAADREMYSGSWFNIFKAELETGERFGNPEEYKTQNMKKHANYGLLENGFPKKGQIINKGDVIIGKSIKVQGAKDERVFKDTSIIYTEHEEAIVDAVVHDVKNAEEKHIAKVKISTVRKLGIGDKFSSRAGQKGMTSMEYAQMDLPFTERGEIAGLIINPHSIPSRMTINQLLEGQAAKLAALKGVIMDGTIYTKNDPYAIGLELEKLGYDYRGTEVMYNGFTGQFMDLRIFMTQCYYQRLQKFVVETVYSVSSGPTNLITRQPLEGKSNNGGLRLGEMEKDTLVVHGSGRFISSKLRDDSDGFDIYVCGNCGKLSIVNETIGLQKCKMCGDDAEIYKVPSAWASKLFIQELESMSVGCRLGLRPYWFEERM